ncbi:YgfZ/GcvT domain-containing protein [Curtobacterium sp. VKM Ac-1393]|uniref:CAF17-like 4Fe-4S cluster assembly/insertion protein YgfZ n=1 Tax=Curtobacterium sp. VKM Ac-1393 TaxID=2783814 RepID=UPI001889C60A|nr:folate-binding protein YgfZ [Curtobacterium sp. VKM Ac-1393]MBF4607852.1 folate-binding protein YgfZ [Curtobacterium sp. VKM Ac-1393]
MAVFGARDGFVASASGPAAHFGNPIGEQRLLERGSAVVDLGLGVVTVSGPDRLSWLNSITSQQLSGLPTGVSTETLVLDQSGRVEHAARVVDDGATVWLLAERADAAPLAAWLDSMRFMLRVEVTDRSADFVTVGSFTETGAVTDAVVEWVDPWASVTPGGWSYASLEAHPGSDWTLRIAVLTPEAAAGLAASDRSVAGLLAFEALRIAAWRPTLSDADERTIPHELDWLRSAVHLSKGCYRGQETVAKVHNLGHPPRRVVQLHLDGSDAVLPAPGTPVMLGDKEVGRLSASAVHHELGPIGLAVVKRSLDPTATLTLTADDVVVTAAQETIVPPEAGATANVPRLPRLGAVKRS